jgi:glycosyltransferase involved in cell wall biosynthesis
MQSGVFDMPKVSVILTSRNHEKFICETIQSILMQTFEDFELIVWDDASTDDSWAVIGSCTDRRIKAFQNETQRYGANSLIRAITEIASGEYIAIHHSDDVWEPDKLQKQVEILDRLPEVGAVFSWANIIDDNGNKVEGSVLQRVFAQQNKTRHEWLRHFLLYGNALCHPSVLIRKQCYRDCGLYRLGMWQLPDFDMWTRLCLKYEIFVFPEPLVRFRWHGDGSNSSAINPMMLNRCAFEAYLILENYRQIDKLDDVLKILPWAEKYLGPNGSDPGFVLAMALLDITTFGGLRLFAQKMLFELISDPARAARIEELHSFDYMDFMEITQHGSIFVSALAETKNDATPLAKGIQTFKAGNCAAAIEHLSSAMTQEPDNPLPPAYLAFIAVHQGDLPKARNFIALCERIAPERYDITAAFGESLLKAGHPEIAADYLWAAVGARPDLLTAYPALAQSLNLSGRSEEAVSILESVAVVPSDMQANIQSALLQILAEHGNWRRFASRHQKMFPGNTGYCPVCASIKVLWFPLPDYYRQQSKQHGFKHSAFEMTSMGTYSCSVCGASDRERLYALFLDTMCRDKRATMPESMIHFAPEQALSKHIRQKQFFASYKTADLSMPGVDHHVDLQALPFDDDSCGFFICSHVLEHVPDDRKAIKELYRITKPGGGGLLMAPICTDMEKTREDPSITSESERWRLFGQNDHVRLYSHDDYVARIKESGFFLRQMTQEDFGGDVFRLLGLESTSILYVVSKP